MTITETTALLVTSPSIDDDDSNAISEAAVTALRRARRLLYTSHFAAQFSAQAWQFGLILFLAAFTNYTSFFLVSSYGLTLGLVVCIAGPSSGRYFVDSVSWNRLASARFLIWSQNASVLVATAFCYALLVSLQKHQDSQAPQQSFEEHDLTLSWLQRMLKGVPLDLYSVVLLVGIHIFGPLAQILDMAFLVSIERDWVVVMGKVAANIKHHDPTTGSLLSPNLQPSKAWLSDTNVFMKQIDLTSKVVAPSVAGFIIGAASSSDASNRSANNDTASAAIHASSDLAFAALLVGLVNAASLVVEYVCTARIYKLIPALALKQHSVALPASRQSRDEESNGIANDTQRFKSGKEIIASFCTVARLPPGLKIYMEQPISWAGLGLALLYLNVLTFGALMTAFLVWRGMRLETVGLWRGVSSTLGLAGTFAYHFSTKRFTLVTTGMWSVLYQLVCISLSFGSLFVASNNASMFMLIGGVCASRIGLWVFDITVITLMQEFVPEGIRGVVGGTQQSLNAFFQLSSFGLGFIFPDPRDFTICVSVGYAAVYVAAISYVFGVFFRKDEFLTESERMQRQ